jgi:hypothetical protein
MGRERAHLGEVIRLLCAAGREAELEGRRRVGTEHSLLAMLASQGRIVGRLPVGQFLPPVLLSVGFGSIWVRDDSGNVLRIAPRR